MALPPVLKEELHAEPKPEDILAQERASLAEDRTRLEKEMSDRSAAQDQRMAQMEGYLRGQATAQPAISASEAQEDLGLTQEQIARDPDGALKSLTEHIRKKTAAEVRGELEQEYAPVIRGLAEQAFEGQIASLKSRKYYTALEGDINQYFTQNPAERQIPGRAREVYEALVGRNVEDLEKTAAELATKQSQEDSTRDHQSTSTAEPPIRRGGAYNPPPVEDSDKDPELTPEEDYMREKYNGLGANISKKEWVAIAEGKVFPKANAADWEKGWRTDNRKVTRGE